MWSGGSVTGASKVVDKKLFRWILPIGHAAPDASAESKYCDFLATQMHIEVEEHAICFMLTVGTKVTIHSFC